MARIAGSPWSILFFTVVVLCLSSPVLAVDTKLAWDPSVGASGYKIQMSVDLGKTWGEARDAGAGTTFTWVGAPDTGLLLFRVSAFNSTSEVINTRAGAWYCGDWVPPQPAGGLGLK